MTVGVGNAVIEATVQNGPVGHSSRWCHLIADDEDQPHAFVARLGLRRSFFQVPSRTAMPASRPAQKWHYDVASGR